MSLKVAGGPVTCTVVVEPVKTLGGDVAHRVYRFGGRGVSEGAGDTYGQVPSFAVGADCLGFG